MTENEALKTLQELRDDVEAGPPSRPEIVESLDAILLALSSPRACDWCGKPSKWAICSICRIENGIALPTEEK